MKTNGLYYGDNLNILRRYIPDQSIDLIYLDPPFNSNRDYNVIFKDESQELVGRSVARLREHLALGAGHGGRYAYLTNTAPSGARSRCRRRRLRRFGARLPSAPTRRPDLYHCHRATRRGAHFALCTLHSV